jgi:hypothetical protein
MSASSFRWGTFAAILAASPAIAQPAVYPAQGQSEQRQQKDKAACSDWARQQSGYDPANPPQATAAQPAPVTGSGSRAKGALLGAGIGAIAGNAGAGAATGAVVGGVSRRVRNRNAADAQNQAVSQHVSSLRASYDRAWSACLSGRGYSVR